MCVIVIQRGAQLNNIVDLLCLSWRYACYLMCIFNSCTLCGLYVMAVFRSHRDKHSQTELKKVFDELKMLTCALINV